MRGFGFLVLVFVMLAGSTARAQMERSRTEDCATQSEFNRQLDRIDLAMANAMARVEVVPPKEAEFIKTEIAAALKLPDLKRHRAAYDNDYYFVFQLDAARETVANHLTRARQREKVRDRVERLVDALYAFSDLSRRASDYISNPRLGRAQNKDPAPAISVNLLFEGSGITEALKCSLLLLKEP